MKRIALALLFLTAGSACKRTGPPSLEYSEARDKLIEIRKDRLEDAYLDPRIEDVLSLLSQVDPKSIDAPAARELRAEIEKAREDKAKHDAEEAKLLAEVRASPAMPGSGASIPAAAVTPGPSGDTSSDAGPPRDPIVGMKDSEFKSLFSDCYQYIRAAMGPSGQMGETWGLKDMGACRSRHPGSVGHMVVLLDGRVTGLPTEQEAAPKKFQLVNGQLVPVAEGTAATKPAAAPAAPSAATNQAAIPPEDTTPKPAAPAPAEPAAIPPEDTTPRPAPPR